MEAIWSDVALSLVALPAAAAAVYLGVLTLLSRRGAPHPPAKRTPRVAVVVPAHDEEAGITETVRSLHAVRYPQSAFRVVVVADNCRDRTAAAAAAAGAEVLVRQDQERRGKGHALRFAFDRLLAQPDVEALVVVDADTVVSPNLLSAFAARFARGARAVQARYGVRNARESWRTRLLAIAFGSMHGVRSLARERLSLSCGLRGNGMGFTRDVLRQVPHDAFSIVEDLEYGIQLGCRGHRVHYVDEAEVLGDMAASEGASRGQRRRWEGGRRAIARAHATALLRRALAGRDRVLADLAIDLLVPPLSTLVAWCSLGVVACAVAAALGAPARVAPWLFGGSLAALVAYVLRGWSLSGVGARGLLDLMLAPVYVAWKLALRLLPSPQPGEWVRTARAGEEVQYARRMTQGTEVRTRPRSATANDGGSPADERALAQAAEAIWVAAQESPWSSLVIVPGEPGLDTAAIARAVAAVGSAQRGEAVENRDLRGAPLADSRALTEALADRTRPYGRVVAVDWPVESRTALLLSRSADAAILVVQRRRTPLADARRVVELLGGPRFLGAVVLGA
jgi:cellulose synthase/poly-beta-1,6-N-acetylglucosamine synthase-like glycosyltransferase